MNIKKTVTLLILLLISIGVYSQTTVTLSVAMPERVEVNTCPDIDIELNDVISLGTNLCATTYEQGKYKYLWDPAYGLNDSTLANPTASPKVTTLYVLTVFDSSGCSISSSRITVNVLNAKNEDDKVTVFPNPTQGKFNIRINEIIDSPITIRMYNPNGEMVLTKKIKNNKTKKLITLDASHLQKANYILIVEAQNFLSNQNIIIN